MRSAFALCLAVSLVRDGPVIAQQPGRDLPRTPIVGSASISGIVISDDNAARPLRRVRVFLNNPDEEIARTTISDDGGQFRFDGLPAGRYTIGGAKEGYVTCNYGAGRPGGPGAALTLTEGLARSDITLPLLRGAVITGTLLDPDGQPIPGVSMRALRYGYTTSGERRLTPVRTTMASHITDDRGVYRIFGLPPGEYVIAAPATLAPAGGGEALMMTEGEVRRALEEVRQSQRQQTPVASEAFTIPAADPDAPRAVGYATIFYPGTPVASQSLVIPLGRAEERVGVDFQLQYVPMSSIRGSVIVPPNVPPNWFTVHLIATDDVMVSEVNSEERRTSLTAKEEFSFINVAPGSYTIVIRAAQSSNVYWGTTDIVIDGQSQPEVALSVQSGLTVSGRVAFDGRTAVPNPSRIRVTLLPLLSASQVTLATTPARVDATGRFAITGVTAGKYRLQATIDGSSGWMLSSSTVNGRDVLDFPLEVRQSLDGAVVTFSDRPAEVSGVVRNGSGRPVSAQRVVFFATDRTLWTPRSRRIRAVASGADGAFQFRLVPAGEYYLAAAADIDDGEWYDPGLLERLVVSPATKVTIADGEKKTLDVIEEPSTDRVPAAPPRRLR